MNVHQLLLASYPASSYWLPSAEPSIGSWLVSDNPSNTLSSGNISVLADKSGKSLPATPYNSDANNNSEVTAASLNGRTTWKRKASNPTGAMNLVNSQFSPSLPGVTMAIVHRLAASQGAADTNVFRINTSTNTARCMIGRGSYGTDYVYAGGRRLDSDSFNFVDNGGNVGTSWLVIVAVFDYTAGKLTLSVNGTSYVNASAFSTGIIGGNSNGPIGIGHRGDGPSSASAIGDYAEALLFSSALSDTSRQKLEGYLAWEWGLQGSLPSGHPYKSARP